jgi:ubiquinone/menaquinone biosynthesis C-methylase UbiE
MKTPSVPFNVRSYELHANNPFGDERFVKAWGAEDTVDAWRHRRMRENLDPLLHHFPGMDWLTVGDGRYGTDAHYILTHGGRALATDISERYLARAKQDGYITDYKIVNCEQLSFADGQFDFVFCKESFHHFPRPMLALYEMLRVARFGVILIEPTDKSIALQCGKRLVRIGRWQAGKNFVRDFLDIPRHEYFSDSFGEYETVGNYVYALSQREIEKVALGLNLKAVAFKGMNDHYIVGVEFENAGEKSELFRKVKSTIAEADRRCQCGKDQYGLLVAAIFKEALEPPIVLALTAAGFNLINLPANPYA